MRDKICKLQPATEVIHKWDCPICIGNLTHQSNLLYCSNCNQWYNVTEEGDLTCLPS